MATEVNSDCLGVIEVEHYMIHQGSHFFINSSVAVLSGATSNIVIETPAKYCHFYFSIFTDIDGFTLSSYENATANSDGTLLTPLNNNRVSTKTSNLKVRINPTGVSTSGSTQMRGPVYAGSATNPVSTTIGTLATQRELILKPNTKYLITVLNNYTGTQNVNYNFQWYELPL